MDTGKKIKELRNQSHLTQKDLAEKLYVSAQAVSRWENGEVEPSIETLKQLSSIFGVSLDELLCNEVHISKPKQEKEIKYADRYSKPVLAICENCNSPIYEKEDIVRLHAGKTDSGGDMLKSIYCSKCAHEKEVNDASNALRNEKEERKRAFVWSSVISIAILVAGIIASVCVSPFNPLILFGSLGAAVLFFPFLVCCFLDNTFVGEMWGDVASWGFKSMPGIIFSLDFDGIIFLICTKILLGILSFLLACLSVAFATVLGLTCGLFAFPYAIIRKNKDIAELESKYNSFTAGDIVYEDKVEEQVNSEQNQQETQEEQEEQPIQ